MKLMHGHLLRMLVLALSVLTTCLGAPDDLPSTSTFQPARPPRLPNVLLILADDLGYADLGIYGNRTIATPHIDRMAQEGMRFTSFYANGPTCAPTRVSLLTGRYPQRFGLFGRLRNDSPWGLQPDVITLSQRLRGAGYDTMHVGKWHVGHAAEAYKPLARGFDRFFGFFHALELPKTYRDPRLRRDRELGEVQSGHLTDLLTAEAESFLRRHASSARPFFLNLWTFNPHKPLEPPPRWAERYPDTVEGRYAALVSTLDENVGRLLSVLDDTGLACNTCVVFLSDNGGARDVHNGHNGSLRGGKNQLLEGGIRVPLIVRCPGRVAAGQVSEALVASFDIFATILDFAGIDLAGLSIDGRSLKALLQGTPDDFEGPLFWADVHAGETRFAVRHSRWKLRSEKGRTTLYDLSADPGEATDLAPAHPKIVAELTATHQNWRAQLTEE